MARLRPLFIALLLLLPLTAQAQEIPPQLALALNQLSTRIGRPLTLTDLDNWSFQQNFYTNTSLGCQFVAGEERPEGISGITFIFVYQGITYDYRVSADGTITFPCDPNLVQQPVSTPLPTNCPPDFAGFLPPRLNIGGQARIGTGGTANRLRQAPNINAEQIGLILPGSTVTILDGPSCEEASRIIWWRIDDSGTVGWTAEGVLPNDYFLAPVGSSLPAERSLITLGNADTLVPLATLPLAGVNTIAFSQDGALLALGGRSGLSVYDLAPLRLQTAASDVSAPVFEAAFSSDRRYLAYTTLDGRLLSLDLLANTRSVITNPSSDRNASLSFNPASPSLLASASGAPVSALLRPSTWRFYEMTEQQEVLVQETADWVRAVAFSLDGTLFAWMDNAVHVIEVDGSPDVELRTFSLEEPPNSGLVWRPAPLGDAPTRALAFPDGTLVRLINLDTSTEQTFEGDSGFIPQTLSFNADGTLLAAMNMPLANTTGSTINLFDAETGDLVASNTLEASVTLRFSPDGTLLVVASADEVVFLGAGSEQAPAAG